MLGGHMGGAQPDRGVPTVHPDTPSPSQSPNQQNSQDRASGLCQLQGSPSWGLRQDRPGHRERPPSTWWHLGVYSSALGGCDKAPHPGPLKQQACVSSPLGAGPPEASPGLSPVLVLQGPSLSAPVPPHQLFL